MLVRARQSPVEVRLCTTRLGSGVQLRNASWYCSKFGRNQQAVLHTVANNSVNETPVQKLVALPQVLKDQVNIPAGTIKGCFDTLVCNPHKIELLADVPFLLTHGVQLLHEAEEQI